jgi:hypothetical protein
LSSDALALPDEATDRVRFSRSLVRPADPFAISFADADTRPLSDPEPDYTLFHRIAEPASARVRLRIVELGLKPRIDFQNAETDGRDELARLGGSVTPALWDGRSLTVGEDRVTQQLAAIRPDREDGS